MMGLTVGEEAAPDAADLDVVDAGLGAANDAAAPLHQVRPLRCLARQDGRVIGGALGRTWGACAELQQLWVEPAHRGQGLGGRLVRRFEAAALRRGSRLVYLDTFSFQAPGLYRRLGYERCLTIGGYAPGIAKHTLVKTTWPAPAGTQPAFTRPAELCTPRLWLRGWMPGDREAFAALNADPEVMRHFPATLSRAQSDASVDFLDTQWHRRGYTGWAVERHDSGEFIGFVGLIVPRQTMPFSPCVEVGWRLARAHWGHGFATEAAEACLRFAFEGLGLDEIVSYTAVGNTRSRAVMQRLGLRDSGQDFDHPVLPQGHPLRRHVLYRLGRAPWRLNRHASP